MCTQKLSKIISLKNIKTEKKIAKTESNKSDNFLLFTAMFVRVIILSDINVATVSATLICD